MDFMKRNPWISTALLAVVAVAGTAEAKTNAQLSAAPGVSTTKEGADPAALLSADAAKAPIESRLQWAAACGEVPAGQTQAYSAVLDVDATGAVTAVTRGVSDVAVEVGTCLDGVFKEVRFPALSAADASVKVTVSLSLVGEAEAAPPPAPVPAAEPAPALETKPGSSVTTAAPAAVVVNTTEAKASTDDSKTSDSKPWSVSVNLGLSAGTGMFVRTPEDVDQLHSPNVLRPGDPGDTTARYLGYSLSFSGSYKLSDLLRASIGTAVDQELTATNQTSGPRARTFFWRETSLGLATTGLWKDTEYTGIGVDVSGRVFLPTDAAAIAAGRVMALGGGLSVKRAFADIGPGTISLSYGLSVRGNFGAGQRTSSPYNQRRRVTTAGQVVAFQSGRYDPVAGVTSEALGGLNTMASISNRFSASYAFLDDWTVALEYGINNAFQRDATDSEVVANLGKNTIEGGGQTESYSATISLSYQLNDYVGLGGGIATAGDPFIYRDGGYALRFPFFDFNEPENNLSTFFLNVDFSY